MDEKKNRSHEDHKRKPCGASKKIFLKAAQVGTQSQSTGGVPTWGNGGFLPVRMTNTGEVRASRSPYDEEGGCWREKRKKEKNMLFGWGGETTGGNRVGIHVLRLGGMVFLVVAKGVEGGGKKKPTTKNT